MSRAHAIVVGASAGIGAEAAKALLARGHVVSGLARRPCPAATSSHPCDVTSDQSVKEAVAASVAAHGPPDVLVYASGEPAMGHTLEVPPEVARHAFEVNFWGMDRVVRAVFPIMAERRRGTLLLVSSIVALRPVPHEAFYAASKAAAARYMGCLAFEAARVGLRVKQLHVGLVDTGFSQRGGWFGMARPATGRGAKPADVGAALAEFLSDERPAAVLGWRERAIALGDRAFPDLYDWWLKFRGGSP